MKGLGGKSAAPTAALNTRDQLDAQRCSKRANGAAECHKIHLALGALPRIRLLTPGSCGTR